MLEMLLNVKVSIHRIFRTDLTVLKSQILMLNKQNVEKISLKKFNCSISEKREKSER